MLREACREEWAVWVEWEEVTNSFDSNELYNKKENLNSCSSIIIPLSVHLAGSVCVRNSKTAN